MRRKTKQLLATGMALAVLATNLTPVSLAAEMAAEMQTDTVATQALSDEIAVYKSYNHNLGNVHAVGNPKFSSDGTSYTVDWAASCGNDICKLEGVNFRGTVGPVSYDSVVDTCTDGKVYYFNAKGLGVDYKWSGIFTYYHTGTLNMGAQKYEARKPGHALTVTWNGDQARITCARGDVDVTLPGVETLKSVEKATCAKEGRETYCYTVEYDGVTYESETTFDKVIPKTEHSYDVAWSFDQDNKKATATFTCEKCGDVQTREADVTKSVKDADCEHAGSITYTADSVVFNGVKIPGGTKVVETEKLGHDYTTPEWTWSADKNNATLTMECKRCGKEVEEAAKVDSNVTTQPTCDTEGVMTFTATATVDGKEYKDTATSAIEATGHSYELNGADAWTWTADANSATASVSLKCAKCDHVEGSVTATVTDDYRTRATCTADGSVTYTAVASINGQDFEDTKTVILPKLGHNCDLMLEWDDTTTYTSATATVKCSDCDYERSVPVEITSARTEPTCTQDGHIDYTATADVIYDPDLEGRSPEKDSAQINGQITLPATGHFYVPDNKPVWNAADKTVEFHFECLDEDDEQTVTVPAEKVDSVAPTCTAAGKDVYVADAEYEFVYNGETCKATASSPYYEIVVPATGHHFGAYTCTANGTEVATCEYCGAADVRPAGAETVCDHHDVDGTDVCPVCGKVNGNALLPQITADSNANTKAITSGAQLVVRAGTLPNGQKVLTVAYLDANGKVLTLNGSWKVRVPVAQLKAALGDAEGTGFEHTLTTADAKQTVGYAVENGSVVFDAAFNGSTAFVLLVD